MSAIEIALTIGERMTAAHAAGTRQMRSIDQGRADAHRFKGDGYVLHLFGLLAEIAVARATNTYLDPFTEKPSRGPDVGKLHVRGTPLEDGCLLLHDTDPAGRYVLVIVTTSVCRIIGYFDKTGPVDPRYFRADVRNPAYFVPQDVLTAPDGLLTPAELELNPF